MISRQARELSSLCLQNIRHRRWALREKELYVICGPLFFHEGIAIGNVEEISIFLTTGSSCSFFSVFPANGSDLFASGNLSANHLMNSNTGGTPSRSIRISPGDQVKKW